MEIKLNLKLETLFAMITFLEHMDMETFALIAVAVMMIPFIIYSLWSLTFALLCQLFWLGVKGGLVLITVCSMIMALLTFSKWRPGGGVAGARALYGEGVKCTMMDVVLTVLFQAGVRIPSGIWGGLMDYFVKGGGALEGPSKITKKIRTRARRGGNSKEGGSGEEEMSAEDNTDGLEVEVFEDIGAKGDGDYVAPRSVEEAIIKEMLLDEEALSDATGETGTRRKSRSGRKRSTRNNNN